MENSNMTLYDWCMENGREDILKEWDQERNGSFTPNTISLDSKRRIWWKCFQCGHSYMTRIDSRVMGFGCPECGVARTKTRSEENKMDVLNARANKDPSDRGSIVETHPDVANEWDYNRNGDLKPEMFSSGYANKVWWVCSQCGNEYVSRIADRTRGHGCPQCARQIHGQRVRDGREKMKQVKIATGYEKKDNIAITHPSVAAEWNYELNGDLRPELFTRGSSEKVWWTCPDCGRVYRAQITSRTQGSGCPECGYKIVGQKAKIRHDKIKYDRLHTDPSVRDSIVETNPDIAAEWNYELNGDLRPEMFSAGSARKVWWTCSKCGNVFCSTIDARKEGGGCLVCFKKKLSEKTSQWNKEMVLKSSRRLDLARPDLLKEWDYEKNGDLLPSMVSTGSARKVWWKCPICHLSFQRSILGHVRSLGCPSCKERKPKDSSNIS